jgi:hypothetical protein
VAAGSLAPRIVFVRPIMPELVEHMRRLDDALVLFENTRIATWTRIRIATSSPRR